MESVETGEWFGESCKRLGMVSENPTLNPICRGLVLNVKEMRLYGRNVSDRYKCESNKKKVWS